MSQQIQLIDALNYSITMRFVNKNKILPKLGALMPRFDRWLHPFAAAAGL
jgi:hypothetical protein